MPTIQPEPLTAFARGLFEAAGVSPSEAAIVAGSLVDANLCGHDSHGVMRIPQYVGLIREGKYQPGAALQVLSETPAILAADAGWGLGQVQAYRLLERLLPKARALGVAAGTLRHCGHIGRLGEYAEWAAARNLASVGTVNSHGAGRRVAPPGGTEGCISTNPLCIGAPTPSEPVILDIGTSACAEGKVRVAFQKGEPVPEGWLLDSCGRPTTDPAVLYADPRGTILPFGGPHAYKSFGLGLILDLLAGGLSGGRCSNPEAPLPGVGNTVLFVLLDIEHFGGAEHFLRESGCLAQFVRDTPRATGVTAITLPGDPERQCRAQRSVQGIPISDGTWSLLVKLAGELSVAMPDLHVPTI
jgi:LDH2 family malate/lactate/ureidoglycolate dehydrogenase